MKVLYVLSGTTRFGGASKAFIHLIEGLIPKGVNIFVLCPDHNGIYEDLVSMGVSVKIAPVSFSEWPPYSSFTDILLFIPRLFYHGLRIIISYFVLLRWAELVKPDIIHTNISLVDIGFRVSRKLRIPHVWHLREYNNDGFCIAPSYKSFLHKLSSPFNYNIAITKGVYEYYSLRDLNSIVIYDGVLSVHDIRLSNEKKGYYLYAGRLEPSKGIEDCLEAFKLFVSKIKDNSVSLLVAGDSNSSSYMEWLKAKCEGYPVVFLGMRTDISDLMYYANAVIVPSYTEGFGFVSAESMFNGTLLVGRNTTGIKEQMDNGLCLVGREISLRFSNTQGLYQRLCEIHNNGLSYYREMVIDSQDVVKSLYTKEVHSDKVFDYYNRILAKWNEKID